MNKDHILEVLHKALAHQFDDYTWDKLIDDCEGVLTLEERQWAKEHTCYAVKELT